jgi:SNF2 family DNA or RNA helicase
VILAEVLAKIAAIEYQPHQVAAADALHGQHGVVVYHGLGAGKTLSSILAADRYGGANVVVPAALQENYKKELRKAKPKNHFNIQSYEGFAKHPPRDVGEKMLVVDEAHRLRNPGVMSDAITSAAARAKKVMLLTGTPVQNKPHELASLVNIAAGKKVLPTGKDFDERYLGAKTEYPGLINSLLHYDPKISPAIANRGELEKAVRGRVSFYEPGAAAKRQAGYPTVTHHEIPVVMSPRQAHFHEMLYAKLNPSLRHHIEHSLPADKKDIMEMDSFLSAGRQISNTTEAFDKNFTPEHASKINEIARRISRGGQSIAYSNYIASGIKPLSRRLAELGVPHRAFTGEETPTERKAAVNDYNSGKIKAILLSSAGGEGLDLKGTRAVHITDPHWHIEKINQVVGRGARFGSHSHLPERDRNVTVYHYISKMPTPWFGKSKKTADEYLSEMSNNKKTVNDMFLGVARHASGRIAS